MWQTLWNGKPGVICCIKCDGDVGYECGGGEVCASCCKDETHGHCCITGCRDRIKCDDSNLCLWHCKCGVGHCAASECCHPATCNDFCDIHCTEFHEDDEPPHCISPDCGIRVYCGMFCRSCCESTGHTHCSVSMCGNTNDCNGICKSHCTDKTHDHCPFFYCIGEDCEQSKSCAYHCQEPGHGHCIDNECPMEVDCGNLCSYHCTETDHGHCSVNECDYSCVGGFCFEHIKTDKICAMTGCFDIACCDDICYHHCTDERHYHCKESGCGGMFKSLNPDCSTCTPPGRRARR